MDNILSKRTNEVEDWDDFLVKYITKCCENPYEENENPEGYVNLGTAVNNMNSDKIFDKFTKDDVWHWDTSLLVEYREGYGIMRLREALAKVMTEFFETPEPISPEDLICVAGVGSCIDVLAHCLADPGDVFLAPTPMYARIKTDLNQRALVDYWPVPVITANNSEDFPVLTIEKIKSAYQSALSENKVVKGVFLINPHNPLGDIYSPELLMDIMSFCHEFSLHVVVDEIYALSVFSKTNFHSILKFHKLPDPERTHVLYGLSKDFCLPGLRVGVIHTKCKPLRKYLHQLSFFQTIPFPVMDITARYLEDIDRLRSYIKENQESLTERFEFSSKYLQKIGLKVRDSSAGFFLWADLRHLCKSKDQEDKFFKYLIEKEHLYIVPGNEFFCDEPGWFRIIFTRKFSHLKEGLDRLARAVKEYKPSNI